MFSFFRDWFRSGRNARAQADKGLPERMNLEDRKLYRREMLYQSVRETFVGLEVAGGMYRFTVMPVDERHHRFIVMVDVTKAFVTGKNTSNTSFAALESQMRSRTYKRYGVLIEGIYWRISETEKEFERYARTTDSGPLGNTGGPAAAAKARASERERKSDAAALARMRPQPASEDEVQAFMAALNEGRTPSTLRVGEREYHTDLSPLEGGHPSDPSTGNKPR